MDRSGGLRLLAAALGLAIGYGATAVAMGSGQRVAGSVAGDAPVTAGDVYYESCRAAAAGGKPIRRGEPGYSTRLDADGDGVACEWIGRR